MTMAVMESTKRITIAARKILSIAQEISSLERDDVQFDGEARALLLELSLDSIDQNLDIEIIDTSDFELLDREKFYRRVCGKDLALCHPLTIFPLAREMVGGMGPDTGLFLGMDPIELGQNEVVFFLHQTRDSGLWVDIADPIYVQESWIFRVR